MLISFTWRAKRKSNTASSHMGCWFTLHVIITTKAGTGTQAHGPLFAAARCIHLGGRRIRSTVVQTWTGSRIWHVGISSVILSHCSTLYIPNIFFKNSLWKAIKSPLLSNSSIFHVSKYRILHCFPVLMLVTLMWDRLLKVSAFNLFYIIRYMYQECGTLFIMDVHWSMLSDNKCTH